ncbi:MAG: hypothetical protein HDS60_06215 [Barnesiella sp.]|nr:hypothetical protein [Barnesiella sp.]
MSTIPTKDIDGDVSVSRNVAIGGGASVRGSATIDHNLKVLGWLDAPNIKGPNKGLFKTALQLRESYPNPHEGWWALVGNTLPAQVYIADGGTWVAQTNSDGTPCLAGNPTVDSAAYNEAVEQMSGDINNLKQDVKTNASDIKSLRTTQTTHGDQINNLQKSVITSQSTADKAADDASEALSGIDAINRSKAAPGGLAPLDSGAKVSLANLPDAVINAMEFNCRVEDVATMAAGAAKTSTDTGCLVVFDTAKNAFLLAVVDDSFGITADQWQQLTDAFRAYGANAPSLGPVDVSDLWEFDDNNECVGLISVNFNFYTVWGDAARYGVPASNGYAPVAGKRYFCAADGITYKWDGSCLTDADISLGTTPGTAFPGDVGAEMRTAVMSLSESHDSLQNDVTTLTREGARFINLNTLAEHFAPYSSLKEALKVVPGDRRGFGTVVRVYLAKTDSKGDPLYVWETYQWIKTAADKDYNWEDPTEWEPFGSAGSADGNCLNVTVEIPKTNTTNPYYDIASAIEAVFSKGRAKLGLQITFAATAKTWKQYQYIGSTLNTEDFCNELNWIDLAGTSAGTEPLINVNSLCGEAEYTLSTAIKAVLDHETESGIKYFKSGIILTYKTAEKDAKGAPIWETYQFTREVSDINPADLKPWMPFGAGSQGTVETKEDPAPGGTDAFSTGGAYNALPTQHEVIQEDGTVSILLKNAAGEPIMEPINFIAATGGGGDMSGTLVSIKFEKSPLFGALGAEIVTRAAIRSITMVGVSEVDNAIATLELIDRDTNLTVWSENVNKPSSASMDDFSFSIDFTPFLSQAGLRRFTLKATDEAGYSTTKFISVTAEDITVSVAGVQVLHVREDAMITPSMTRATVDLFKFENNQSDKGIDAVVDILINGEWKELHRSVVTDTYTKSISFNPAELGLTHGAYPIRISGTSLNSGVKGNTVYSAIMVVDPEAKTPLVAIRYDDKSGGTVKLYESVVFDVAVYNPTSNNTIINTKANDTLISQLLCDNTHTYNVSKQIQGFADGDVINLYAKGVSSTDLRDFRSYEVPVTVSGSVIDATLKEGSIYSFDFSSRSNSEADHSIVDGDYRLNLTGANYTSNGFGSFLGQNCLRIAENVTGSLNHMPFASQSLEAAGMAWQCQFATNNIKDANAMLLECYDPTSGAGFYIKGNKVGIFCRNGNQALEERSFRCGEQITLGIAVEPSSIYVERSGVKYSALRMYLNGELVAHIGYIPGRGDLFNGRNITMNGTYGDLYIYYMLAYQTHYEWAQAFKNYLVKLVDTEAMIKEFNAEDVLTSQTAEGSTAMRPSSAALWARGIPYVVLVADDDTFNAFDGGTSTSDNFEMTVYYYDPKRPWRSFKATKCRIRRQGTTSAKRCKKNVRIYLSKASEITPLFPDYDNADAIITYKLFAKKKIRVGEKTMAVDLITIKIDYSDAGGANDCGVCDMMNATYRALGDDYMTPAQRFFDGTQDIGDVHLEGLELNHSTANHPIAVFRSTSDTLQNVYFEAKGNWKEDKGEQTALGFMNTPGYNIGCQNYQDGSFIEYYGLKNETLNQTEARFRADTTVDTTKLYLISQYCGNRYRFMKYVNGEWAVMSGKMKQIGGKGTKWKVEGYVLNPVIGFELLTYQDLDWWRGVDSVESMMKTGSGLISSWVQKLIDKGLVTADVVPLWTYYFECMVDNDDLAIAFATGKKVPFELYRMLRFCDSVDPDKHPTTYADRARQNFYKFLNVRSKMVYYVSTDYNSLYDQQAKNMQPMFFLEDGCSVVDGIYYDAYEVVDSCDVETLPTHLLPMRMYFNKVYDADGANGKDNDGGCTGDPECDPAKPTDEKTGYANPYAGWNAILWVVLRFVQEFIVDDAGNKTDLRTVVAAMRSVEANVDGVNMKPFSPDGAMYFFMEKRLRIWPKMVSSYDGIRKYVQYTATSDTIYFYALQGLGLTSLPDFIEKRWRIRDGYYQTGAFFSGYISARIACAAGAKIRFTAAKTGYFGIGNDNTAAVSESVYLEAGESYEFSNFSHQTGALVYIYQADRMSMLDLSEISLGSSNGEIDFTLMQLVVTLILGSATHAEIPTGYRAMTSAKLGNLPFLESFDARRTGLTAIDGSGCPRLRKLDARDSAVESFSVAETSPINEIAMPDSLAEVTLVGLPNLTYTGLNAVTGLRVPSLAKVQKLRLETSPKFDAKRMLEDTLTCQQSARALSALRFNDMPLKGNASELQAIIDRGVAGLDSDGNRTSRPVINTVYELTTIRDEAEINRIEAGIEGITLFTVIEAFISLIDQLNGEYFSGDSEVATVTLDNIGEHITYYNGETFEEYARRMNEADRSIHEIIHE